MIETTDVCDYCFILFCFFVFQCVMYSLLFKAGHDVLSKKTEVSKLPV